jgi:hypothetical protein
VQKYYAAGTDRLLRVTTRLVWALFFLPPAAMAFSFFRKDAATPFAHTQSPASPALLIVLATALLMAAIACLTRAMAPRGFSLNDIELTVDRALKPATIKVSDITEARRLSDPEHKGSLRLLGASGFYGHYGLFWNRTLGKYRLYACRSTDLVLVRTAKALFVLGPDSPDDFLSDLTALLRR